MGNLLEWLTITLFMCSFVTNSIAAALSCCVMASVVGVIGHRFFDCWKL